MTTIKATLRDLGQKAGQLRQDRISDKQSKYFIVVGEDLRYSKEMTSHIDELIQRSKNKSGNLKITESLCKIRLVSVEGSSTDGIIIDFKSNDNTFDDIKELADNAYQLMLDYMGIPANNLDQFTYIFDMWVKNNTSMEFTSMDNGTYYTRQINRCAEFISDYEDDEILRKIINNLRISSN